jgi:nitrilase
VRNLGVFLYLGTTERATSSAPGTVFCTLVSIDPAQSIVSTHRNLMPTHEERLVWGSGGGHGLRVHRYAGTRIGGLNCWENWMPQARHALYAQGEELHVSVWPGIPPNSADITRFIALAAPDGVWVAPPVVGQERLVIADVDLRRVSEERQNFDPTGHYSRPDVFRCTSTGVDAGPRSSATERHTRQGGPAHQPANAPAR